MPHNALPETNRLAPVFVALGPIAVIEARLASPSTRLLQLMRGDLLNADPSKCPGTQIAPVPKRRQQQTVLQKLHLHPLQFLHLLLSNTQHRQALVCLFQEDRAVVAA